MKKKLLNENQLIIVDVGASGGVHERWLKFGSVVKSILFEPDRGAFQKLISNEPKNSLIINAALADSPKVVDFHICKWQEVSSIYKPNFNLLEKYEDSERFEIKNVSSLEADSLNNLLKKEKVYDIDFIKIDTQGSELDILKGASDHFQNLIGMEVEVEFIELYHDQPLFNEVNSFIESKGLFDNEDRRKHIAIREQHPELDIRFVFSNAQAKLYKGSKTRYSGWCEKHGFKWAHRVIPLEWLTEKGRYTKATVIKLKTKRKDI